jgi:bifunctional non-homologous end joining protein LigD
VSLEEYRRKRDAARTPEPVPDADPAPGGGRDGGVFVVQEHHARAHHFDLRLERDGVLKSWAIPKGVPTDPAVNHLAIPTEDHPLEYATFAGEIPRGEYGAGTMSIYDRGTYECVEWTPGDVKVVLRGQRLTGGYALFRTGRVDSGERESWMIHRERQPLPADLEPMLAVAGELPRDDDGWSYEMKWDGQRALAWVHGRQARLRSRTGRAMTRGYPELAALERARA